MLDGQSDQRESRPVATIRFTTHLLRHRAVKALEAKGATVAEVLGAALAEDALLQSYVLDDQGRVRKHVHIYLDGALIKDRLGLSDPVRPASELYVLQALSGG